jgi:thymidine kinase
MIKVCDRCEGEYDATMWLRYQEKLKANDDAAHIGDYLGNDGYVANLCPECEQKLAKVLRNFFGVKSRESELQ